MIKVLKNLTDLEGYLDFVLKSLYTIKKVNINDWEEPETVLEVIRKHLGDRNFLIGVQVREDTPCVFFVVYIAQDLYDRDLGVIWLMHTAKGFNSKEAKEFVFNFFDSMEVSHIEGGNLRYEKGKERWFKMNGFKKLIEIWRRPNGRRTTI